MMRNLKTKYSITINNKIYPYFLSKSSKDTTFVSCKEANINQEFPNEDVPALLIDLPNLILAEKEYKKTQQEIIRFRISQSDKKAIEQKAIKKGYSSVSSFLRDLALGC